MKIAGLKEAEENSESEEIKPNNEKLEEESNELETLKEFKITKTSKNSEENSEKSQKPKEKKKFDFKLAFSYIYDLKDPKVIFQDQNALVNLANLYVYGIVAARKLEFINTCFEYGFSKIICDLLEKSYLDLDAYLASTQNPNEDRKNDKVYEICVICIGIVRNFSNYSIKFITETHRSDVIKYLFKFLKNGKLIELYADLSQKKAAEIIRGTIGSLVNLSKLFSSFRDKWKHENAVETLLEISERLAHKDDCELASYITLANIADDDEINKLEGIKKVVPGIVKMLSQIAKTIETKKNLRRIKVNLNEENMNESHEIARVSTGRVIWHLIELIDALYHMACNDTIKYEIYDIHGMNAHLRCIIYHGNQIEVEYALKLLWQLCFDERIAKDVRNDETLIARIKDLANSHKNQSADTDSSKTISESLIKNANGIIWLLSKNDSYPIIDLNDETKHIMISYNHESRDLCLKIKEELEKRNFRVWIDVEEIHGSSLEAMAKAVEQSLCVLICMTEKYKMSPYCRAEAEYTFQLGKPFVPLIMQENYKPDGWLGIILGSKIFVNFTKYEFNECIRRLMKEMKNYLNTTTTVIRKATKSALATTRNEMHDHEHEHDDRARFSEHLEHNNNKNNEHVKWTESDVDKWLEEKKINPIIRHNVHPCNGQILNQLYVMQCHAPEFFYKSISSNESIPTRDVAIFAFELKKIFQ